MSLTISTYKLSKEITDQYFTLNEKYIKQFKNDGLKDFLYIKEADFLDFPTYFGITEEEFADKYECISITDMKDKTYTFLNRKHPLYTIYI